MGRELVYGDGYVRCAIERQAALVADGEVGLVGEDGARVLSSATTGDGGCKLHFKMDEQGSFVVEEQVADRGGFNGAAAEGENQVVIGGEMLDGCVLAAAEFRFTVAREDFWDGEAGFGRDDVIRIDKAPAKARGDERADGGFAGAHETGEDNASMRLRLGHERPRGARGAALY